MATLYAYDDAYNYSGLALIAKNIRKVVECNELLAVWIYNMDRELLRRQLVVFNDSTFKILESAKNKMDKEELSDQIDLEMQKRITSNYGIRETNNHYRHSIINL